MSTLPADTPGGGGGDADIVVTDRQLFDSAVSDPAPQPSPPQPPSAPMEPPAPPRQQPQPPPQQTVQPGTQPRDAHTGRFQQKPPPQQQRPQQGGGGPGQEHHVPLRTYLDEREQRYRIQAEHDQMRRAWVQLQEAQQRTMQEQQARTLPQTIYDNPDMYLQHNIVQPLRNEGHLAMMQIKDGLSREFANAQFGEQNVTHALSALAQVRYTPDGDHLFRQIMSSGHPYGALVRWFQHARAQQAIGPDPMAWARKQRDAWLDDEQMQAEAARRWYAKQQRRQGQQQQRAPGGGQPNVQLPPSLSSLPASSGRGAPVGDLSDASLWRAALR